ncbi:MAG: 50S ribosomal protein L29 [Ignavibacteriales bacterium]|nr:50S ribosomal protein L29 [Ignavibacteriales bacterium]
MKAFEFRQLSDSELLKRLQEEQENLSHLKFQKVIGQLENPMKIDHIKKDIARMRTILRERALRQSSAMPQQAQTQAQEQKA